SVGYENPLHFSRAFKTIYGVSPRDWRRKKHPEV
ncbi:MAG: helix-turn-helix transcriptional regulator, partial [Synergistaceae bacterium]|nr:helix-turn-helix transcriptional regulator [Synergistaceae bacterium]